MAVVAAMFFAVGVGATAPADASGHAPTRPRATVGQVTLIQAVPGASMDLAVDGRSVKSGAGSGAVVGPVSLTPGDHTVTFTPAGGTAMSTQVTMAAGASSDVVIHLPAAVDGVPVVNTYQTPTKPIGADKARVMLAHTATVAPADVAFDGKVVFKNIANGEFAEADVPMGAHQVALLPAGQTTNPILGPLSVDLKPGTVTMVYAVGRPQNGSMKVITHTVSLATASVSAPQQIKTGSAGLVSGVPVSGFAAAVTTARGMAVAAFDVGVSG